MISVDSQDRIHIVGNSITNPVGPNAGWHLKPTGFKDRMQGSAYWHNVGSSAPTRQFSPVTVTEFGVNGQAIAAVDAAFDTQITPFNPTVLVMEIGINDTSTLSAAFTASYSSVVAKALVLNPNMKFLFGSCLCNGELWSAGPVWSGNATDTDIARINTLILAQITALKAAGKHAEYMDWRAALLKMEVARNSPAPGVAGGRCTIDNVHPSMETCLMMSDVACALIHRT